MNHHRGEPTAQIAKRPKHKDEYYTWSLNNNNYYGVRGKQLHPNTTSSRPKPDELSLPKNLLLAGYMANEFLTKGTLLGEKFDQARAQAVPLAALGHEPRRKPAHQPQPPKELKAETYAELATLLKTEGVHIPGVVNPSQLARWFQI